MLSSRESPVEFTRQLAEESVQRKAIQYDRQGDAHYDSISALIKSIRGSDPDAALYWLARMLEGGEDVRFLARRLVILASEDVGNADPAALPLAVAAAQACELVGLPECQLTWPRRSPTWPVRRNRTRPRVGIGEARADVREGRLLPVPVHLRDSHYGGAKRLGHGEGYQYAHDHPDAIAAQDYLGVERQYYRPTDRGFERELAERLAVIRARLRGEERGEGRAESGQKIAGMATGPVQPAFRIDRLLNSCAAFRRPPFRRSLCDFRRLSIFPLSTPHSLLPLVTTAIASFSAFAYDPPPLRMA